MVLHRNAKLGLAGRLALVRAIESGLSLKRAAARFTVSPATAHRWWHRWQAAMSEERETLRCLLDRSSRPRRSPRMLTGAEEEPILRARRETGYGPGRLAGIVRRARSTVWNDLAQLKRAEPHLAHEQGRGRRPERVDEKTRGENGGEKLEPGRGEERRDSAGEADADDGADGSSTGRCPERGGSVTLREVPSLNQGGPDREVGEHQPQRRDYDCRGSQPELART